MDKYEIVIGIEIHCQMNTKTKMFCGCSNDSFNAQPNSNVCPVCMGFPGQLPYTNKEAIKKGIKAGLALNCSIEETSAFDRKNYFYPDSPKGYQITQNYKPIAVKGHVDIKLDSGEIKSIGIHHMHLEEDAGKLTHTSQGSLVDFNRCGTPLMEIVTEPDMRSIEEASKLCREIQKIMRYSKSSDADMEKGMMRFDINVSIMEKNAKEFGTKVEVKNLNSFQSLERALEFEIKRQIEAKENNQEIFQETRGFNVDTGETTSQRSKESAYDYRYFPEPDLPIVTVESSLIQELKKEVSEKPLEKRERYQNEYSLAEDEVNLLSETLEIAQFFEEAVAISNDPKTSAAFLTTYIIKHLNDNDLNLAELKFTGKELGELVQLINDKTISFNIAKNKIIGEMLETGKNANIIIEEKGLKQISDTVQIETWCKDAINSNPKAVEDFRNGNEKAIGALVGGVMKASKGQANPGLINKTLVELLNN